MKPAAGANVNFLFVESRSELFGGIARARVGPAKNRRRGTPVAVDTHQAMPKAGNRNQLHAIYRLPGVLEKLIERAANEFDQVVWIQFVDVAKSGEDAIAVRLGTLDLFSLFVEKCGPDA